MMTYRPLHAFQLVAAHVMLVAAFVLTVAVLVTTGVLELGTEAIVEHTIFGNGSWVE